MVASYIIFACWIIFYSYWLLNWRKVKPTKKKKARLGPFRLIIIAIVVMVILNHSVLQNYLHLYLCQPDTFGCHVHLLTLNNFRPAILLQVLSSILAVGGLTIAILGRKTLADNWSSNVELKENHALITNGIYAYVRHPIYLGMFLMLLSIVTIYPAIPLTFFFLILMSVFIYRIKKEEELMSETFPKEYRQYQKKVKRLIPFVF